MKVSVLIPVFNAEKYLRQCLESVLSQTHKEIEIIIIDDGSIDASGAICDQYAVKDKRVNVIHQANHGLIPARLRAIEACNGQYVTFVDADDLLVPNAIETMYQLVNKNDADIVACKHQTLSAHGLLSKPKYADKDYPFIVRQGRTVAGQFCGCGGINAGVWAKLYRKEVIDKQHDSLHSLPNVFWGEDTMINALLFSGAGDVVISEAPIYKYRVNGGSNKYNDKILPGLAKLYHWRKSFLQKNFPGDESYYSCNITQILNAAVYYASTSKGKMQRLMACEILNEVITDMQSSLPYYSKRHLFDSSIQMNDETFCRYYKERLVVRIKQLVLRLL